MKSNNNDLYGFITPSKQEQQNLYQHLFSNIELNEFANIPATIPKYFNQLIEKIKLLEQNQQVSGEQQRETFRKQELYISQLNKLSRQQQVEIDNLQSKIISLSGLHKEIKQHVDTNEVVGYQKIDEVKQHAFEINKNVSKEMKGFLKQQQDFYNEIKEKFVSKEHFRISLFKETADQVFSQYPAHFREILQIEKIEQNLKVQIEMVERNMRLEYLKNTDQLEEMEKKVKQILKIQRTLDAEALKIVKIQDLIKEQELESMQVFRSVVQNNLKEGLFEQECKNDKVFKDMNIKMDNFKSKLQEINQISEKLLQNTQNLSNLKQIQIEHSENIENLQQTTKYCKNNLETLKILIKDEFTQKQKQEINDNNNNQNIIQNQLNQQKQQQQGLSIPPINGKNNNNNINQILKNNQGKSPNMKNNQQIYGGGTNQQYGQQLNNNINNKNNRLIRNNNNNNSNSINYNTINNNNSNFNQINNNSINNQQTYNQKQRSITPIYKNQRPQQNNSNNFNNKTLESININS